MTILLLASFLAVAGFFACHKQTRKSYVLGVFLCFVYSLYWAAQPIREGLDVFQYYKVFQATPSLLQYEYIGNHGYLFSLLMAFVKFMGLDFRVFMFVNYIMTSGAFFWGFLQVTRYPVLALLFTLLSTPAFISMVRLHRQGLSVALVFLAVVFVYKKRHVIFAGLTSLAVSLHLASLVYAVIGFSSRKKVSSKTGYLLVFTLIVAICVAYFGSNPGKILSLFDLLGYDGKYHERGEVYIYEYDNDSLRFGVSRVIEVMVLGVSGVLLLLVRKGNDEDVDLKFARLSLVVLSMALIFYVSFIWSPILSRFVAFGAPYFALLMVFLIGSVKIRPRFMVRYSAFSLFLVFYVVRVLVNDVQRIPTFL